MRVFEPPGAEGFDVMCESRTVAVNWPTRIAIGLLIVVGATDVWTVGFWVASARQAWAAEAAEQEELRNARELLDKLAGSPAYRWPEAEKEEP